MPDRSAASSIERQPVPAVAAGLIRAGDCMESPDLFSRRDVEADDEAAAGRKAGRHSLNDPVTDDERRAANLIPGARGCLTRRDDLLVPHQLAGPRVQAVDEPLQLRGVHDAVHHARGAQRPAELEVARAPPVPLLAAGELGAVALVAALSISASVVDSSPFSTNGALVVANAPHGRETAVYRGLMMWGFGLVAVTPLITWAIFVLPGW